MNLDVLLPYLKMGEYTQYAAEVKMHCEFPQLQFLLCVITQKWFVWLTAALQKVSPQSGMTVEQRTEEADWFRKIGTKALSLLVTSNWNGVLSLKILQHLHFLCVLCGHARVCACVCPCCSLELSSAVQEQPWQNEGFLCTLLPGKWSY